MDQPFKYSIVMSVFLSANI